MGRFGPFVQIGTRTTKKNPVRRPASRTEDGSHQAAEALELFNSRSGSATPSKVKRCNRTSAASVVHQVRRQVRFAEAAGRSVHRHAGARAGSHCLKKEADANRIIQTSVSTTPGVERPLRSVHHRRQTQCAHAKDTDPRSSRSRSAASCWPMHRCEAGPLRPQEKRQLQGARQRCAKDAASATTGKPAKSKTAKKSAAKSAQKSDATDSDAKPKKKAAAKKKSSPKPKKKESKT